MSRESEKLVYEELIDTIVRLGHPAEFGIMIADSLKSENAMSRMSSYLHQLKPTSAEEIADEMICILEQNNTWKNKKISEYYNIKINTLLNEGLGEEDND